MFESIMRYFLASRTSFLVNGVIKMYYGLWSEKKVQVASLDKGDLFSPASILLWSARNHNHAVLYDVLHSNNILYGDDVVHELMHNILTDPVDLKVIQIVYSMFSAYSAANSYFAELVEAILSKDEVPDSVRTKILFDVVSLAFKSPCFALENAMSDGKSMLHKVLCSGLLKSGEEVAGVLMAAEECVKNADDGSVKLDLTDETLMGADRAELLRAVLKHCDDAINDKSVQQVVFNKLSAGDIGSIISWLFKGSVKNAEMKISVLSSKLSPASNKDGADLSFLLDSMMSSGGVDLHSMLPGIKSIFEYCAYNSSRNKCFDRFKDIFVNSDMVVFDYLISNSRVFLEFAGQNYEDLLMHIIKASLSDESLAGKCLDKKIGLLLSKVKFPDGGVFVQNFKEHDFSFLSKCVEITKANGVNAECVAKMFDACFPHIQEQLISCPAKLESLMTDLLDGHVDNMRTIFSPPYVAAINNIDDKFLLNTLKSFISRGRINGFADKVGRLVQCISREQVVGNFNTIVRALVSSSNSDNVFILDCILREYKDCKTSLTPSSVESLFRSAKVINIARVLYDHFYIDMWSYDGMLLRLFVKEKKDVSFVLSIYNKDSYKGDSQSRAALMRDLIPSALEGDVVRLTDLLVKMIESEDDKNILQSSLEQMLAMQKGKVSNFMVGDYYRIMLALVNRLRVVDGIAWGVEDLPSRYSEMFNKAGIPDILRAEHDINYIGTLSNNKVSTLLFELISCGRVDAAVGLISKMSVDLGYDSIKLSNIIDGTINSITQGLLAGSINHHENTCYVLAFRNYCNFFSSLMYSGSLEEELRRVIIAQVDDCLNKGSDAGVMDVVHALVCVTAMDENDPRVVKFRDFLANRLDGEILLPIMLLGKYDLFFDDRVALKLKDLLLSGVFANGNTPTDTAANSAAAGSAPQDKNYLLFFMTYMMRHGCDMRFFSNIMLLLLRDTDAKQASYIAELALHSAIFTGNMDCLAFMLLCRPDHMGLFNKIRADMSDSKSCLWGCKVLNTILNAKDGIVGGSSALEEEPALVGAVQNFMVGCGVANDSKLFVKLKEACNHVAVGTVARTNIINQDAVRVNGMYANDTLSLQWSYLLRMSRAGSLEGLIEFMDSISPDRLSVLTHLMGSDGINIRRYLLREGSYLAYAMLIVRDKSLTDKEIASDLFYLQRDKGDIVLHELFNVILQNRFMQKSGVGIEALCRISSAAYSVTDDADRNKLAQGIFDDYGFDHMGLTAFDRVYDIYANGKGIGEKTKESSLTLLNMLNWWAGGRVRFAYDVVTFSDFVAFCKKIRIAYGTNSVYLIKDVMIVFVGFVGSLVRRLHYASSNSELARSPMRGIHKLACEHDFQEMSSVTGKDGLNKTYVDSEEELYKAYSDMYYGMKAAYRNSSDFIRFLEHLSERDFASIRKFAWAQKKDILHLFSYGEDVINYSYLAGICAFDRPSLGRVIVESKDFFRGPRDVSAFIQFLYFYRGSESLCNVINIILDNEELSGDFRDMFCSAIRESEGCNVVCALLGEMRHSTVDRIFCGKLVQHGILNYSSWFKVAYDLPALVRYDVCNIVFGRLIGLACFGILSIARGCVDTFWHISSLFGLVNERVVSKDVSNDMDYHRYFGPSVGLGKDLLDKMSAGKNDIGSGIGGIDMLQDNIKKVNQPEFKDLDSYTKISNTITSLGAEMAIKGRNDRGNGDGVSR